MLAALKTIKKNGLEAKYIDDKITLLEELIGGHKVKEEMAEEKSCFPEYKGDVFVYTDGGSRGNPGPSGCGCIIEVGDRVIKANKFLGHGTNNETEYSGVKLAVEKMIKLGLKGVKAYFQSDSQLTRNQLSGKWRIKEQRETLQMK